MHINLDEITELTDSSVYRLKQVLPRPYEKKDTMLAITIEASLDQDIIMRETLTVMDILADIGGFAEVLIFTSSMVLSVFNYQYLNSLIASKLYEEHNNNDPENHVKIELPSSGYFCAFFIDCLKLRSRCSSKCIERNRN